MSDQEKFEAFKQSAVKEQEELYGGEARNKLCLPGSARTVERRRES